MKREGYDNTQIKMLAETGMTAQQFEKRKSEEKRIRHIKGLYEATAQNNIGLGTNGALIYELQKLLQAQGYDITLDGVFKSATYDALSGFESSKGLFPDGRLDKLTLDYLLE